jgi:hypothetical protein
MLAASLLLGWDLQGSQALSRVLSYVLVPVKTFAAGAPDRAWQRGTDRRLET